VRHCDSTVNGTAMIALRESCERLPRPAHALQFLATFSALSLLLTIASTGTAGAATQASGKLRPSDAAFVRTVEQVAVALVIAIVVVGLTLMVLIWRRHRLLGGQGVLVPVARPAFPSDVGTLGERSVFAARQAARARARTLAPRRRLVEAGIRTAAGGTTRGDAADTITALMAASDPDLADSHAGTPATGAAADPPARSGGSDEGGAAGGQPKKVRAPSGGSSDTAKLKAKLTGRVGTGSTRETDELKRKLKGAKPASEEREAAPPDEPATVPPPAQDADDVAASAGLTRSTDPEHSQRLPPEPVATRTPLRAVPAAPPLPPQPTRVRVGLSRGYMKSQFYAAVEAEEGDEGAVVAVSPDFRWRKSDAPPQERDDVAAAHSQLLETLGAAGWRRVDEGDEWFDVKLELTDDD
jgi:hypothetical protein